MKTDPNSLHDALVELATTMSPNPDRLRQVRQRVARRRRRRVATGAAVSVGAVAGTLGIAVVPREPRTSLQFNATGSPLPACATVSAPVTAAPQKTAPAAAKPAEPDAVIRYKGVAVVTQVGAGTLTLGDFSEPGVLPPTDSVVMVVDSATTFDGAAAAAPEVAVGQRVVFVASVGTDGRDHLDVLDFASVVTSKPADPAPKPSDSATDAVKPAAPAGAKDEPATDGVVRGKGLADAAPENNELAVSAYIGATDPESLRLRLGSATQYFRFETACTNAEIVAGTPVVFAAVDNGDGTYTATEMHLYE
jgi:hypothetical protein